MNVQNVGFAVMPILFPHKLVKKKTKNKKLFFSHRIRIRFILVWKHFCLAMTHQAHLQRKGNEENGSEFLKSF